jgi:Tfp pilus assembly protein PilZ
MPGQIVRRQGLAPVLTGDVGFRGALLRTDAPPPLRELLLLRFDLPPAGDVIEVHAMAVWNVPPGSGSRSPGVGVQFFAVPSELQKRWNDFIRWVARTHPESSEQVVAVAPGLLDPVRRHHERVEAALPVRLHDSTGVRSLTTRYVSRGGMYVWVTPAPEVGTCVELEIPSPSPGSPLRVTAIVRSATTEAGRSGVGVEFVGIDEAERDEIVAFAVAARDPARLERPVFVMPGDPGLAPPPPDEDLFADLEPPEG